MKRKEYQVLVLVAALLVAAGCGTPAVRTDAPEPAIERATIGSLESADPRFDALVPADAAVEVLARGFEWTEGPVWVPDGGYVLFSDIPRNTIYRWDEEDGLGVYLRPAGYTGPDPAGEELGTNGLVLDAEGRLVVADHGNRGIARIDTTNFTKTFLATEYQGRRLNSPNDLVYRSSGDLYFTDPPYGLRGLNDSPVKELDVNGVYRLSPEGELTLVYDGLSFPNGIALSPDERTLYVANSDPRRPIWMAFDVAEDGSVSNGRVFFDASEWVEEGRRGMPDGLAVDAEGNLWATGPGGVNVFAPDGTHLGTIHTGQATANVTFGDDGSTLYITADPYLARIRTNARGLGF